MILGSTFRFYSPFCVAGNCSKEIQDLNIVQIKHVGFPLLHNFSIYRIILFKYIRYKVWILPRKYQNKTWVRKYHARMQKVLQRQTDRCMLTCTHKILFPRAPVGATGTVFFETEGLTIFSNIFGMWCQLFCILNDYRANLKLLNFLDWVILWV